MRENVARLRRQCRSLAAKLLAAGVRKSTAPYRGWDDIAAVLEVSDTTAQGYAARDVDPLPVRYDFANRPCLGRRALGAWVARQAHYFRTYHELKRTGRLPGQVRTEGKKEKRQRRQIKPAIARRAAR